MKHLILLITIFISGCYPESEKPLSEVGQHALDLSLIGTWFWATDKESGYLHIGKNQSAKNELRFVLIEIEPDDEIDIDEYIGYNSVFDEYKYLNIVWNEGKENTRRYIFVKYSINENKLLLSIANSSALKNAVKERSLNGYLTKEKFENTIISEAADKIQKYLKDNDKKIFVEYVEMTKQKI